MRIKLEKGKQRKLIETHKDNNKLTWKSMAKKLSVSEPALKEWRLENCLIPKEIFDLLNKNHGFDQFVMKVRDDKWGQSKGGKNSTGNTGKIKIPKKSEKLAELVGIILGDGNIHAFSKGKKVRAYSIRIAGHAKNDRDYLTNHVFRLFKDLFDVQPRIYKSKRSKAMYVNVYNKALVDYFLEMGLKKGNKITSQVTIPKWILKDKKLIIACIRGLIDTDGSIYRMSRKDANLKRISFKNYNQALLKQARNCFIELGFHPSKIICGNYFTLSRQEEIKRYISMIEFNNSKHINRF
ncbi:MAG: hypothetical protein JXA43_01010 [Candidatus Diapherotrites archaeon]|nr:hypothetical protein [Candidatus Diapherotrites archaeon]